MPIDLTELAPAAILANYPGIQITETQIWNRFLALNSTRFQGFLYNVRVGEGFPTPLSANEREAKFWQDVTMTRIDALGVTETTIQVFEVKHNAGHSAIGQVIAGRILAELEIDDPRPLLQKIVTNQARPDTFTVATVLEIEIFQV